jgi:hypothetical protein
MLKPAGEKQAPGPEEWPVKKSGKVRIRERACKNKAPGRKIIYSIVTYYKSFV